jgi:hypothetical protein
VLKNRTEEQLRKQNIKSQMDVLMLAELRNGNMSGYDTIGYVHERFGVYLTPEQFIRTYTHKNEKV